MELTVGSSPSESETQRELFAEVERLLKHVSSSPLGPETIQNLPAVVEEPGNAIRGVGIANLHTERKPPPYRSVTFGNEDWIPESQNNVQSRSVRDGGLQLSSPVVPSQPWMSTNFLTR